MDNYGHPDHFRRYFLGKRRPPRRHCDCLGQLVPHLRGVPGCTWAEAPAEQPDAEPWCSCNGLPDHRHTNDNMLHLRRLPTLEEHAAIQRWWGRQASESGPGGAQAREDEQLSDDATRALLAALVGDHIGGAIARLWKAGQTTDPVLALNELAAAVPGRPRDASAGRTVMRSTLAAAGLYVELGRAVLIVVLCAALERAR